MSVIYEAPLAPILYLIVFRCLQVLPKNIEALYYKENILTQGKTMAKVFDSINFVLLASGLVILIIIDGFGSFISYMSVIIVISYTTFFISGLIFSRNRDKKTFYRSSVYFGLAGCQEEIAELCEKHPEITIKRSAANSPLNVYIKANSANKVDQLKQIVINAPIFEELDQTKYKVLLVLYSFMSFVSILYLISLVIYHLFF